MNFFNTETIELAKEFKNATDVIYAANVICHIPNLIDFINSVDQLFKR